MRNLRRLTVVLLVMILAMSLSAVAFAQETQAQVTVSDQEIVDGTVTIESVTATENGWIVIHRSENGSVGADIGHAAVEEGENQNVAVEVDVAQATETLYAMLHVDAGTEGTYEFPGPDTPVQGDAAAVNPTFMVTNLAAVQEEPAAQETATPEAEATETPVAEETPTPEDAAAAQQETATPEAGVTPGTLPETGANLQEATPETLPETGASLQEATPETLPETGASLQEATPETLPETGASLQEATPETLPETGASLQEATPETLPETGAGGMDWTLPLLALGGLILVGGLGLSMSRRPR